MSTAGETPWHAAFPSPRADPGSITRHELLSWMKDGKVSGSDYILIDLRRNDHQGGTIRGSINLPAQSLYPSLPSLCTLFKNAGVKTVICYCGSSRGRGTRAAAWFADHIAAQNDTKIQSVILEGGIKGWATAGAEFVSMMVGYDASVWSGEQEKGE